MKSIYLGGILPSLINSSFACAFQKIVFHLFLSTAPLKATKAIKTCKSAKGLHVRICSRSLDEESINLTCFSSDDKLFAFIRCFYGPKGLPIFFTKQMSTIFQPSKEQGYVLVSIDDILLLSNHKLHMLELIEELHKISTKYNHKIAPEK